jgi:hypothetical protein
MKSIFIPLIFLMIFTFSCKKDNSKTNTDRLTASGWVATSIKYNPPFPYVADTSSSSIIYIADLFDVLSDCAKDDVIKFEPSGNYIIDSKVKCQNESDIYELGNWSFNSTETKLFYGILSTYYDYDIISLTDTELKISRSFNTHDSNNQITGSYTETTTYKHE